MLSPFQNTKIMIVWNKWKNAVKLGFFFITKSAHCEPPRKPHIENIIQSVFIQFQWRDTSPFLSRGLAHEQYSFCAILYPQYLSFYCFINDGLCNCRILAFVWCELWDRKARGEKTLLRCHSIFFSFWLKQTFVLDVLKGEVQ